MYVYLRHMAYPSGGDLFRLLANCSLLFCSDLSALIFPTLMADLKNSIRSWHRVLASWVELLIARAPSIILL